MFELRKGFDTSFLSRYWMTAVGDPQLGTRERLIRLAPKMASLIAALAIVIQLVSIVHDVRSAASAKLPVSPQRPPRKVDLTLDPRIGELFGVAPRSAAVTAAAAATPKVPLNLTGVVAAPDPAGGFAILTTKTDKSALYKVGSSLPGGARLASVYADRVEVEWGASHSVIHMPFDRLRIVKTVSIPNDDTTEAAPSETEVAEQEVPAPPSPEANWVQHHLSFEQRQGNGDLVGYTLAGGGPKVGFRLGDVLTAINGVQVTDRDQAATLLASVDDGTAQFTVLRGGSPVVLTVHVRL